MDLENMSYNYSILPPHIITNILSYLPVHQLANLATVCHAWYDASLSLAITQKIAVRFYGNANVDRFFDPAVNIRPFAHVYFSATNFSKLDYRTFLNKFGKNIRHVEFNNCDIKFEQLLECIGLLKKLQSLTIETGSNTNWDIELFSIMDDQMNKNLNGVKTLSIKCHTHENFTGAHFILSKCMNLNNLTYVIALQRDRNTEVTELYEDMISAMDQWERVDLNSLSIENDDSAMCDAFFTSFHKLNVTRIKKLNLRNIRTGYHPRSLNQFCAAMYDIEELDVDIKEHSNLTSICTHLTNLKRLSINALPTKNIEIIENLHSLEVLEVTAFDVSEQHLLKIFNSKMPNLRKLSLNIMILNKKCLIALCNNFKGLEYLNVTLNTTYYYPIFKNLHNLKHLTIYWEENSEDKYDEEDCNILELQKLERLYVDVLTPAMTAKHIASLPNLRFYKCMAEMWTKSEQ